MQVSISSITIPPVRTPGICTKNLPPLWGFASKLLPRGRGFVGVFVHNDCPKGRASALFKSCPRGLSRGDGSG